MQKKDRLPESRHLKNIVISDPPDVFQVIETDIHFHKVFGTEAVLFFELLFVKRVESKSVKRVINHGHPPIFE